MVNASGLVIKKADAMRPFHLLPNSSVVVRYVITAVRAKKIKETILAIVSCASGPWMKW